MFVQAPFEYVPISMATREHPLEAKANVNDWLRLDRDGNPVLFAPADEVPEGVELCEPLQDGEVVPFLAVLCNRMATIIVEPDGSYVVPSVPATEINWFELHEGCGATTLRRLAELMVEEGAIGRNIIRYYQRAEVSCLYNGETHTLELMDRQGDLLDLLCHENAGHA